RGDSRAAGAAYPLSQDRYAGRNAEGIHVAAAVAGGVHFRSDHRDHHRRPEDENQTLPVWRQSRLLAVRLHSFHGAGRGGKTQAVRAGYGRGRVPRLREDWPHGFQSQVIPRAVTWVTTMLALTLS